MIDRFPRFADLLDTGQEPELIDRPRAAASIGRPLGGEHFLARIERLTKRRLRRRKRGPKPKTPDQPCGELSALSP